MIKISKFGPITDGNASMKDVLGGKGANLAEMAALGCPVPPGFTIGCQTCVEYTQAVKDGTTKSFFEQLDAAIEEGMDYLEATMEYLPLVSVRSGARVSMPGMMDTILNVGLTSQTLPHWCSTIGERAAYDSYRRLIQMLSSVALGVPMETFEHLLSAMKESCGVEDDADLSTDALRRLSKQYLGAVNQYGVAFPDTFELQLSTAVEAVFKSWDNPRAEAYRQLNKIPYEWGTAVNVQAMVFGNLNNNSATGVLFTRNPSTGDNEIVGEYLVNAQGEDVVAGIRTPVELGWMAEWNNDVLEELAGIVSMLEAHYKDMQDVEFTIQDGKLYILQTRSAKRSAKAALKVAYDMATEGVIEKSVAAARISKSTLRASMQDSIAPDFSVPPSVSGIAAGGGVVSGVAVFTSEDAVNCKEPCILISTETNPNDIAGMAASVGILTATGGLTSHAAVVARGMHKSCVVGCTDLKVVFGMATALHDKVKAGERVTIDGATGRVWFGTEVPIISGTPTSETRELVSWANENKVPERVLLSASQSIKEVKEAVMSCVSDVIYIDTALLERAGEEGGSVMISKLEAIGKVLETTSCSVVLDMGGVADTWSGYDEAFLTMFGGAASWALGHGITLQSKLAVVVAWSQEVLSRVTIKCSGVIPPAMTKALINRGAKVAGPVTTVADILQSTGPITVSESVMSSVFGGPEAFKLVCEALSQKTGKEIVIGSVVPAYWFDMLKEGA